MLRLFEKKVFGKCKSKLDSIVEARRFCGAWMSLCVSGGSGGNFVGLMAARHPLHRT